MFSPGIRNPHRSVIICLVITAIAWTSVAWGVVEMWTTGDTPSSGMKIGLGLLPAILGPLMALNFWAGMKVFAAIKRGDNQIARWSVTAAELAQFTVSDKARNALRGDTVNDWTPPREPPASGIEVTFVPDGVMVHDTYFALVTTGLFRFTGVQLLTETPPMITFQTLTTYANRFGTRTTAGELRIPVSALASADAARMVEHFGRVRTGEVIANPNFYRRRVKIGLIAAPVCFAIAAFGFLMNTGGGDADEISVPILMIAVGLIFGIGALILALAAKLLDNAQSRKR